MYGDKWCLFNCLIVCCSLCSYFWFPFGRFLPTHSITWLSFHCRLSQLCFLFWTREQILQNIKIYMIQTLICYRNLTNALYHATQRLGLLKEFLHFMCNWIYVYYITVRKSSSCMKWCTHLPVSPSEIYLTALTIRF